MCHMGARVRNLVLLVSPYHKHGELRLREHVR
jgi:hypothetical protein